MRIRRTDEAGASKQRGCPGAAAPVDATYEQHRELAVELPVLVRHVVQDDALPEFLNAITYAEALLYLLLSRVEWRGRHRLLLSS
jgi:PII-like signaling protein